MSKRITKFGVAIVIVLGTLGWLAVSGVQESKTYYVTVKELNVMKDHERTRRLRVGGSVAPGSIKREGREVHFILVEEGVRPSRLSMSARLLCRIQSWRTRRL